MKYVLEVCGAICLVLILSISGTMIYRHFTEPALSDTLLDGQLKVTFSPTIQAQLRAEWREHPGQEYAGCIAGDQIWSVSADGERLDAVLFDLRKLSNVREGEENFVELPSCDKMAVIHSHPSDRCEVELGTSDIEAAKESFRNGATLFMIQCEQESVTVFVRENLYEGAVVSLE